MDADRLRELRGQVIEHAVNVEQLINMLISQHFFGHCRMDFILDVLGDELCNVGFKLNVLPKLIPGFKGSFENDLRRLSSIRNIFAHQGAKIVEGADPHGPTRYPSGKDSRKSLDFEILFKEFETLAQASEAKLLETFKSRGGKSVENMVERNPAV